MLQTEVKPLSVLSGQNEKNDLAVVLGALSLLLPTQAFNDKIVFYRDSSGTLSLLL
jgi:hypothetical protein